MYRFCVEEFGGEGVACVYRGGGVEVAAEARNHVGGVVWLTCRVESVEVGMSNILWVCLKF